MRFGTAVKICEKQQLCYEITEVMRYMIDEMQEEAKKNNDFELYGSGSYMIGLLNQFDKVTDKLKQTFMDMD